MTNEEAASSGEGGALRPMPYEEYERIAAVNWSRLKAMRKSPLQYKHGLEAERTDTDATRLGRAVHVALFEPLRFEQDFAIWLTRRAGKAYEEFCRANVGKTILTEDQARRTLGIVEAVRSSAVAKPYLAKGDAEQSLFWQDSGSGLLMKCRIDWITDNTVVDLKTSRHAVDERQFSADAYRLGYFHQLALYQRAAKENAHYGARYGQGPEYRAAVIIAVEPEPPHDVAVYKLSEDALYAVNEEIDEMLARLARCMKDDAWPGRYTTELHLDLPKWAYPSVEDYGPIDDPDWMK